MGRSVLLPYLLVVHEGVWSSACSLGPGRTPYTQPWCCEKICTASLTYQSTAHQRGGRGAETQPVNTAKIQQVVYPFSVHCTIESGPAKIQQVVSLSIPLLRVV